MLTGFLNSPLGLGQVGRALAKAFRQAGVAFEAYDVPLRHLEAIADVQPIGDGSELGKEFPICICSVNGEHLPSLARILGNEFFEARYIIGVWFWETPELPEAARKGVPYVNEIWTCSEFTASSIRGSVADVPVKVFPYPLTIGSPLLNLDLDGGFPRIADDAFVYLFAFDFHSCVRRKNPEAVAASFCRAFPDPDPERAVCVIKSSNGGDYPLEWERLRGAFSHRPDVIFYDGFLPVGAMEALMNRSDCYVSLHRAEGFGLTLLEAMGWGKPCIATAYSGNMSFMSPDNSWLIPIEMRKVGPGSRHYPPTHIWGEPDLDVAVQAMLDCFAGGPEVKRRVERAQQFVAERHDLMQAARAIRSLLVEASVRPPAVKKLPPLQSNYERAREHLWRSVELERQLSEGKVAGWLRSRRVQMSTMLKLFRENRRTSEMLLKAAREREGELAKRIAVLESQLEDTRKCLAELLRERQSSVNGSADQEALL